MEKSHIHCKRALSIASCAVVLSGLSEAQGGSWSARATMPTARNALAAAGVDGLLYAVGGKTGNTCVGLQTLEEYTPSVNSWGSRAPMPTGRFNPAATELNGKLYVVGGDVGCGARSSANEVYDPATNSWASKAPMPTPRTSLAIVALDGKIYAIGGDDPSNVVGTVEAYDPCSDTWSTKASMPVGRSAMGAAALDGAIYVFGGFDGSGWVNTAEVYNPDSDSWAVGVASMPTLRSSFTCATLNDRAYIVGGHIEPSGPEAGPLDEYDPATNTWSSTPQIPTPRSYLAAGVAGDVLYAVGGGDDSNVLATLEAFTPEANFTSICNPGTGGVIACPCSNPAGGPGRGCDNSAATGGAILWASGVASLSGDSLVFSTSGEKPTATSVLLQGTLMNAGGVVYGQGVRCFGGTLKRLFTKAASGGSITAPNFGGGDPTVSARSAARGNVISAGSSRWYLVFYRDPIVLGGCPAASTFNATQTGQVTWAQ
jgi:N-acetylneuraminic acid mutarotase